MAKYNNMARKFKARVLVNVPAVAGNYADERVTFGLTGPGQAEDAFEEVQVLAESPFPAGAVVELWLRKVSDATEAASDMTASPQDDYTLAGTNFTTLTAAGSVRWALSGWPGGQIRVKSGSAVPAVLGLSVAAL